MMIQTIKVVTNSGRRCELLFACHGESLVCCDRMLDGTLRHSTAKQTSVVWCESDMLSPLVTADNQGLFFLFRQTLPSSNVDPVVSVALA